MTAAAAVPTSQRQVERLKFTDIQLVNGIKGAFYLITSTNSGVLLSLRIDQKLEYLVGPELEHLNSDTPVYFQVVPDPYDQSGRRFRIDLEYYRSREAGVALDEHQVDPVEPLGEAFGEVRHDSAGFELPEGDDKKITTAIPFTTWVTLRAAHQRHRHEFPRFADYTRELLINAALLNRLG